MAPSAVLTGRTLSDVLNNVIVLIVIAVTGLAVGWRIRTSVLEGLAAFLLLLLFAYAISWIMAWVGLLVPSPEVVNNAAFTSNGPIMQIPWRRWQTSFRLQVVAPLQLCQGFVPGMLERGAGRVLNVSSAASVALTPPAVATGASATGAPPPVALRFGLNTPTANVAPLWVAHDEGLFLKYGIAVELVPFTRDRLHERWKPLGDPPEHEERAQHAVLGEDAEQPLRVRDDAALHPVPLGARDDAIEDADVEVVLHVDAHGVDDRRTGRPSGGSHLRPPFAGSRCEWSRKRCTGPARWTGS